MNRCVICGSIALSGLLVCVDHAIIDGATDEYSDPPIATLYWPEDMELGPMLGYASRLSPEDKRTLIDTLAQDMRDEGA